ncbi:Vms1/Ankzf1 family peptidyl-tRNA hydrolase [Streptomyces physcomitrii]|uniref:baeRF2 domain-containing protein n=1 Tax=Streptomyces physcomitrii TaxID=2724184 RepID=UPI0033FA930B
MKLAPLAPLYERRGPWATAYLDTSVADEALATRRELQARETAEDLARQGADEATCRAVREALEAATHGGPGAGVAVFATGGEVVYASGLTAPPESGSLTSWAPLPHVAPLVRLLPDEPDCLVARIDRTGADLELRTADRHRPLDEVAGRDWPVHRTASADWSERHFQLSVENSWKENARTVAEGIAQAVAETGAELIVLAGDERERRTVREALPQHLAPFAVETRHGGRAAGSSEESLDAAVEEEQQRFLRRRTAEQLERFEAARQRPDGRTEAVDGVPALVEAAREHRIETLLLHPEGPDTYAEVWAGPDPDQLATRRTEVRELGEPEPFATRADDALLRSAVTTSAAVVLVPGGEPERAPQEDLAADNRAERQAGSGSEVSGEVPVGGLGAVLRWATEGEHPRPEPGTGRG